MSIRAITQQLKEKSSTAKKQKLQQFFKIGPGQYGEGDVFIGVTVPEIRAAIKPYITLPRAKVLRLLRSRIHEERLAALLLLVQQYEVASTEQEREIIYDQYLEHTEYINNWDLVDLSAHYIVGRHLEKKSKSILRTLAQSSELWERRIAMIATFWFIRSGEYQPTLRIAKLLLHDTEDLIHKAVGWMLREVGKRDLAVEEMFLKQHYRTMPRTMLRYAIEKFPEKKRQAYLKGRMM